MSPRIVASLLALVVPLLAHGAEATPAFRWDRVNVAGGGMNTGILVHPSVPELIYARQDVSGLLRWEPAGRRWVQLLDWMPAAWKNARGCAGFAVDPSAGDDRKRQDVIYAAFGNWQHPTQASKEGNGVFRSFDRGETWTKIWDGSLVTIGGATVFSFASNTNARTAGENMAVDPFNPDVLWVGTNTDGLWLSADARSAAPAFRAVAGAPKGFFDNAYEATGIRSILIDPRGGSVGEGAQKRARIIFIGCPRPHKSRIKTVPEATQTGVFRSLDGGKTWAWLNQGEHASSSPWRLALGEKSGQLYTTEVNGVGGPGLRFFDGAKWARVPGAERARGNALATLPTGLIVAGAGVGKTLVSSDWGKTWTVNESEFDPVNWVPNEKFAAAPGLAIAVDPHRPGRVLFGDSFGVHVTEDILAPTIRWTPWLKGYETTVGWALSAPPVGPRLYYTCADVNGFQWTDDVTVSPSDQLYHGVYADDKGGVGGQANWGIGDSALSDVKWAPGAPENQVMLRSTWKGYYSPYARIYRTRDAGKTWLASAAPPANAPQAPKAAAAGGAAKIAISATDPDRWVYVRPAGFPVYAENGFSGAEIEWKQSVGVDKSFMDVFPYYVHHQRLAADAVKGRRFYYSLRNSSGPLDFWVSEDGGATWEKAGQGLPKADDEIHLAPVKRADGHAELWVSMGKGGLHVSRDGGRTFAREAETVTRAKGVCAGLPAPGSRTPTLYLAGTVAGRDGVFLSLDLGRSWRAMTEPARPLIGGMMVNDLVADGREWGRVYIATSGTGVLYSEAVKATP